MSLPVVIFAIVTLAGGTAAMALRRMVHCALALTLAFAGLGALYVALGAQFVGLAQILVYAGAVAILIVFAILLTPEPESHPAPVPTQSRSSSPFLPWLAGGAISTGVFAVLAWAVLTGAPRVVQAQQPEVAIRDVGNALLGRFVLPLEAIGLMLTAALIGAVILAMESVPMDKKDSGGKP